MGAASLYQAESLGRVAVKMMEARRLARPQDVGRGRIALPFLDNVAVPILLLLKGFGDHPYLAIDEIHREVLRQVDVARGN